MIVLDPWPFLFFMASALAFFGSLGCLFGYIVGWRHGWESVNKWRDYLDDE